MTLRPSVVASGVLLAGFLATWAGCASSEDGAIADLVVDTQGVEGPPNCCAEAWVVLSELELEHCPSASAQLWEWLVPSAVAHTTGSPTLLGTPHVLALHEPASWSLGRLEPPPGRYCGVRLLFAAADEDALGLAEAPWMLGNSFGIRQDDQQWTTTVALEVRREFAPLLLEAGSPASIHTRLPRLTTLQRPGERPTDTLRQWLASLGDGIEVSAAW